MSLIHQAVPMFLFFITLEWGLSLIKKRHCYHLDDFINNMSMGIFQQFFSGFEKVLLLFFYQAIAKHAVPIPIAHHFALSWLTLWLMVDFAYYWLHRSTHRMNLLWAGHSVHHQSEHYNFSVALRQGVLQGPSTWFFYLPIALFGFPTWMFLIIWQLNTIYQFFIHTTQIKTLGPLEYFLNTPSHHRVHHGQNPQYIDKNYAGSLIIWDKLFGTFEREKEPVRYGVTEPLTSFNPFYANVKVLLDTWYYTQKQPFLQRLKAYFMPPEWVLTLIGLETYQRLKPNVTFKHHRRVNTYLILNTFLLIAMTYLALCYPLPNNIVIISILTITLIALSLGYYLDNSNYHYLTDIINLSLLIELYHLTQHKTYLFALGISLLALTSLNITKCNAILQLKK